MTGAAGKVWLFAPPPGAPANIQDALDRWARENRIDPRRACDGVEVDPLDQVIRYVELTDPHAPGAWCNGPDGVWRRRVTTPLLVEPPAELRRPPIGHAAPPQPTEAVTLSAALGQHVERQRQAMARAAVDWSTYARTCDPDRQLDGLGDLALFLGGSEDSFTGKLLALIAKAQSTPANMAALEQGFPREVTAWRAWMQMSPSPTAAELCAILTLATAQARRLAADYEAQGAEIMEGDGAAASPMPDGAER